MSTARTLYNCKLSKNLLPSNQTKPKQPKVHYRAFCHDVDLVFTHPELEKNPLDDVPREPEDLLDKERFRRSSRMLSMDEEARLDDIVARISNICERRGMLVKPFFDDSARNRNSSCLVGHVTIGQFKQVCGRLFGNGNILFFASINSSI